MWAGPDCSFRCRRAEESCTAFEDKYFAVSGTKNHLWMEAHVAKALGDDLKIDMSYFEKLQKDAIATIEKFGDFRDFVER
jgi:hypothetical protein